MARFLKSRPEEAGAWEREIQPETGDVTKFENLSKNFDIACPGFDSDLHLRVDRIRNPFLKEYTTVAHVVTEPCFGCKHTLCVTACPMDCFHEGENMLFIDPDTCIDCSACVAECPTNAIYLDIEVPEPWKEYIALNAEMASVCPAACGRDR